MVSEDALLIVDTKSKEEDTWSFKVAYQQKLHEEHWVDPRRKIDKKQRFGGRNGRGVH